MNNIELRFLDSFKFLSASLDTLSGGLGPDNLKFIRAAFPDDRHFQLASKKGTFPYEYLSSFEKLRETSLPPIENFYSRLRGSNVSVAEYEHAQTVWREFGIRNLSEYAQLYLKIDVLLVTDVFERFRKMSKSVYGFLSFFYQFRLQLVCDAGVTLGQAMPALL